MWFLSVLSASKVRNICVSTTVNDPVGQDDPSAGLALHDDALDCVPVHDDVNGVAVEKRPKINAEFHKIKILYVEHISELMIIWEPK